LAAKFRTKDEGAADGAAVNVAAITGTGVSLGISRYFSRCHSQEGNRLTTKQFVSLGNFFERPTPIEYG
jgi:hypothetical protein